MGLERCLCVLILYSGVRRPEGWSIIKIDDPLSEREITFSVKRGRYVTAAMREFMRLAGIRSDDPDADRLPGRQKE